MTNWVATDPYWVGGQTVSVVLYPPTFYVLHQIVLSGFILTAESPPDAACEGRERKG